MIRTGYKSKISYKLSWPLGTKKVSEAFEGLPQFSDFTLSFSGYDQRKVSTKNDIRVISIEYSFIRLGYGSPKWSIRIYAVPKELKHRIKELVDQGFPQLREWCLSHHSITGNEGSERITVFFDPTTDQLRSDEFSRMSPKVIKQKTA